MAEHGEIKHHGVAKALADFLPIDVLADASHHVRIGLGLRTNTTLAVKDATLPVSSRPILAGGKSNRAATEEAPVLSAVAAETEPQNEKEHVSREETTVTPSNSPKKEGKKEAK